MMLTNINPSILLGVGMVIFFTCLIAKLFETSPVPEGIPWVLSKKGFFGRATERFIGVNPIVFIKDGYEKYSKNNKPFVMPSVNEGDEVLLPIKESNTILFAKETDLSFKAHIIDFFQLAYTSWPLAFAEKYDFYVKLISKDLSETLKTPSIAESLAEEARACLSDIWGEDTENWVQVPLYSFMEKTAGQMINVLAIGPGNSDDKALLAALTHCSNAIVFGANVIKAFPAFLHPIVGPIVGLVNRYFERVFHARLKPIIEKKIQDQKNATDSEVMKETLKSKGSLLDLLIQAGMRSKWPMELTTMWLAYRIFMINFPGVHTSGVSATSVLLDILSYSDVNLVDLLREEVLSISSDGSWTAQDLAKAALLESAIKESLRLNGINAVSPTRKVVATSGVDLGNGLHLPFGTKVGVPQYALHRDSDIYPSPDQYNPFRFYVPDVPVEERRNDLITATSDTYVVFGHGRRQCPGRWIFAHVFKVLVAEMLLKYDIQPMETRPKIHRWGRFQLPPLATKLSVRRKKDATAVVA
ncbi:cytochrome P450 [Aspergillus homomorphus CBS 101889]|uniref:Putative cytochrome P450 n=1 Tax=Aspergillus homomorphus (strain CBS 101889) TaxID=1450537 RepID=A0A395HI36_ASPHC|nr:putative cytochrome P450 [Aspergillus homomorphus CBS 101889]RAL07410.1 putative cytochrome P450 [Aspergillus homomorphus CBS 101889]